MDDLSAFLSHSLSHGTRDDDHLEKRIEFSFEKSMDFLAEVERRFYNNDDDKSLHRLFLQILSLFMDGEISDDRSLHRVVTRDIFRARHCQLAIEYVRGFVRVVPKFKALANVLDAIDKKEVRERKETGPKRDEIMMRGSYRADRPEIWSGVAR